MKRIDNLDLCLIRLLQEDARASYAELARATGISEATVKRRVESLIQRAVITPAMIPDLHALGYMASAFVGITIDLHRLDEIAHTISAFPETAVVTATTGRYDFLVFVAAQSLEELTDFVSKELAAIPGVRTTETFVAPRIYKVLRDWRLSLDEERPSN